MTLVSVLITAYNSDKYIVETIKSILNQTFQDFEIIFVNDGSTDKTEEKIKPYLTKKFNLNINCIDLSNFFNKLNWNEIYNILRV